MRSARSPLQVPCTDPPSLFWLLRGLLDMQVSLQLSHNWVVANEPQNTEKGKRGITRVRRLNLSRLTVNVLFSVQQKCDEEDVANKCSMCRRLKLDCLGWSTKRCVRIH